MKCNEFNCSCLSFKPKSDRLCALCRHTWALHAADKIGGPDLKNAAFDLTSLVLYGSQAIPIYLKVMLEVVDEAVSVARRDAFDVILRDLGWTRTDFQNGYLAPKHGRYPTEWVSASLDEQILILQAFDRFAETSPMAEKMMRELLSQRFSKKTELLKGGDRTKSAIKRFLERNKPPPPPSLSSSMVQSLNNSSSNVSSNQLGSLIENGASVDSDEFVPGNSTDETIADDEGVVESTTQPNWMRDAFGGNTVHDGKIRVLCRLCTKSFADRTSLKVHFSSVHLRELHLCKVPGCRKVFTSRRSRDRHSCNPNPKLHRDHTGGGSSVCGSSVIDDDLSLGDGNGLSIASLAANVGSLTNNSTVGCNYISPVLTVEQRTPNPEVADSSNIIEDLDDEFYGDLSRTESEPASDNETLGCGDLFSPNGSVDDNTAIATSSPMNSDDDSFPIFAEQDASSGQIVRVEPQGPDSPPQFENVSEPVAITATAMAPVEIQTRKGKRKANTPIKFKRPMKIEPVQTEISHFVAETPTPTKEEPETPSESNGGNSPEKLTNTESESVETISVPACNGDSDVIDIPLRRSNRRRCVICLKEFQSMFSMRVHFQNVHLRIQHCCLVPGCGATFPSKRSRDRHSKNPKLHTHLDYPPKFANTDLEETVSDTISEHRSPKCTINY